MAATATSSPAGRRQRALRPSCPPSPGPRPGDRVRPEARCSRVEAAGSPGCRRRSSDRGGRRCRNRPPRGAHPRRYRRRRPSRRRRRWRCEPPRRTAPGFARAMHVPSRRSVTASSPLAARTASTMRNPCAAGRLIGAMVPAATSTGPAAPMPAATTSSHLGARDIRRSPRRTALEHRDVRGRARAGRAAVARPSMIAPFRRRGRPRSSCRRDRSPVPESNRVLEGVRDDAVRAVCPEPYRPKRSVGTSDRHPPLASPNGHRCSRWTPINGVGHDHTRPHLHPRTDQTDLRDVRDVPLGRPFVHSGVPGSEGDRASAARARSSTRSSVRRWPSASPGVSPASCSSARAGSNC